MINSPRNPFWGPILYVKKNAVSSIFPYTKDSLWLYYLPTNTDPQNVLGKASCWRYGQRFNVSTGYTPLWHLKYYNQIYTFHTHEITNSSQTIWWFDDYFIHSYQFNPSLGWFHFRDPDTCHELGSGLIFPLNIGHWKWVKLWVWGWYVPVSRLLIHDPNFSWLNHQRSHVFLWSKDGAFVTAAP